MEKILEKISSSLFPDKCSAAEKDFSKIYKIHKYWARKPWYVVEKYICDYSDPGDTVMDPFCGSGCTGLESVINGRNFIGQDLNPTALRISSGTISMDIDLSVMDEDFATVESKCKNQILQLYTSTEKCPKCQSQLIYRSIGIGPKFADKQTGDLFCPECGYKNIKHTIGAKDKKNFAEINTAPIPFWVPETCFPKKFYKDRFSYKGISTVADMFSHRNLIALSVLWEAIGSVSQRNKPFFELAFSNTLLHVSKLKGQNVRPLSVNSYWIPDDFIEENVWFRFIERYKHVLTAKKYQTKRVQEKSQKGISYGGWTLRRQSALADMGNESVDYFFTDPPYGDAIQYSELSFVWNAWLSEKYETDEEIIINPVQSKGSVEFNSLLCQSLNNIYRALKPDRYFTLCFQNKNSDIWRAVIDYCKSLGLSLVDISIYNTYGYPFNKSWANFSPKSDIYVTFKKCAISQNDLYYRQETVADIILAISHYMHSHKISENNNRLYDLTIAYLIWALFYNQYPVDVSRFDIKKFTNIASSLLSKADESDNQP